MPQTPHIERHFTGSETVRDVVIGMADGLTVPFALAAGLSGAVNTTRIIVTAGLAEIAVGSIAVGLGGYLAAKSDAEHHFSERTREKSEVSEKPDMEAAEVADVFHSYGLTADESKPVVDVLRKRPQAWVDFMMRFELTSQADSSRSVRTLFSRRPARRLKCRSSLLSSRWLFLVTSEADILARHRFVVVSKQRSWAGWLRPQHS